MRGLIQRVSEAQVVVDGQTVGAIDQGLLLLLGVERDDSETNADKLLHKVMNYRVFSDAEGKMNLNVGQLQSESAEACGGLLIVSQFTLAAETKKGLRPGFSTAALPTEAERLYEYFVDKAREHELPVKIATGIFGADMKVSLTNDGPVTFLLET